LSAPSNARVLPVTILGSEPLAPGFMRTSLACPDLACQIQPGQFFNISVPGDARELLRIPMSYVGADPSQGTVEIAFRIVGNGTRRLAGLPTGTRTDLIGPLGHGWRYPEGMRRALIVGGGSGVAPVMALAGRLARMDVEFHVVQGARTSREVIYENEIRALGAARFEITTDDGSRGTKGFPTAVVGGLVASEGYDQVYACGPQPMMRGIAELCRKAGVPCMVSLETGMGCGFGACATCAIDTVNGKRGVCVDGPVFDAEEVIW
jgi:dihydroorotate dehydrogenase electron transfer subunit